MVDERCSAQRACASENTISPSPLRGDAMYPLLAPVLSFVWAPTCSREGKLAEHRLKRHVSNC